MVFIPARPTNHPRASSFLSGQRWQFPQQRFFPRGRDALAFGVTAKKIRQGKILFPAFFCAHSLDEILASGCQLTWMDVCEDLGWDPERFAERLDSDNITAVVFCDFFGFVFPRLEVLVEIANERNVLVIRDCCHSPLSWRIDQVPADLTIFSFRKLIPIWDGGALIGCDDLLPGADGVSPRGKDFRRDAVRRLEKIFSRLSLINPYPIVDFFRRFQSAANEKIAGLQGDIQPSQTFLRYLNNTSAFCEIARIRKENFLFLTERLACLGLYPLIPMLGDNDVPQVFPLRCSSASSLVEFLRHKGVGAVRWPGDELPIYVRQSPLNFPVAIKMNNEIACLPLHQDIRRKDLERMVGFIDEWLKAPTKLQ